MTAEVLVEIAENQFALASGICGNDDLFGMLEEVLDDAKLLLHPVILFTLGILAADELEPIGDNRQELATESRHSVGFGHGQLYQVTEGPGDAVVVASIVADFPFHGTHDPGYLSCDARFLCDNGNHIVKMDSVVLYLLYTRVRGGQPTAICGCPHIALL